MNMKVIVNFVLMSMFSSSVYADDTCLSGGIFLKVFDGGIQIPSSFYLNGGNVFRDSKVEFFTDLKKSSCSQAQIYYTESSKAVSDIVGAEDGSLIVKKPQVCGLDVYEISLPKILARKNMVVHTTVYIRDDALLHVSSVNNKYNKFVIDTYCKSVK